MSEQTLRQFCERLGSDREIEERLKRDPAGVVKEYDLSGTELTALVSSDEDALRRLCGYDTAGFALGRVAFKASAIHSVIGTAFQCAGTMMGSTCQPIRVEQNPKEATYTWQPCQKGLVFGSTKVDPPR